MSINLQKGQKISLTKGENVLNQITIGLGWDAAATKGGFFKKVASIDCDASAVLLENDKFTHSDNLVYFGKLKHKSSAVTHLGDNLTGDGDGDDEQINVDLSKIPSEFNKIVFVVNIYSCASRKQHFGMINNAFIRIINRANGQEICKFNLSEDYQDKTALIAGEIYRHNDEWKFNSLGQATNDVDLKGLVSRYV